MLKISKAALVAAVLSLSAAPMLGTAPAAAAMTTAAPSDSGVTTTLSIPTITAVDSTMDEAALREVFTGDIAKHADEIAALNATSITIPEITMTMALADAAAPTQVTYKDIVLSDVEDGVAGSISMGSITATTAKGTFNFGKLSANSLDLGRLLSIYGLSSAAPDDEMQVLYTDLSFEGGGFSSPDASCTFGKVSTKSFSSRPLKISFAEMMKASAELQAAKDGTPPPEAIMTMVRFMADIFSAYQSEPTTFDGLKCSGKGDGGKPFDVSIGGITVDGYQPGIYPAMSVKNIVIASGDEGTVSVDAATLKAIDLSGPIAVLDEQSDVDQMWLTANWRKLIPSFAGFSFSGVKIDVPDTSKPGSRVKADIADFDLTLSDYLNGIPTKITSKTTGFNVPLDQDKNDDNVKMLLALGIDRVNLNYDLDASWDKDAKTINITKLAVSGNDLGSMAVASVIGNAPEALFDVNPNIEQAAAMALTIKSLTFDVVDAGLGDKLVPMMAAESNIDPSKYRVQMAGIAEGAALQMLGATDEARALGKALGDFIGGTAKSLTVNVDAKDPNGVSMLQLMMAQNDPTVLANAVTITGSAK